MAFLGCERCGEFHEVDADRRSNNLVSLARPLHMSSGRYQDLI